MPESQILLVIVFTYFHVSPNLQTKRMYARRDTDFYPDTAYDEDQIGIERGELGVMRLESL